MNLHFCYRQSPSDKSTILFYTTGLKSLTKPYRYIENQSGDGKYLFISMSLTVSDQIMVPINLLYYVMIHPAPEVLLCIVQQ